MNVDSFIPVQFVRNISTLDTATKNDVLKDISKHVNGSKAGMVADEKTVNICIAKLRTASNAQAVWILGMTGHVSRSMW